MCKRLRTPCYDGYMVRMNGIFRRVSPYATTIGIYVFYLMLLPFITARFVPCLAIRFEESYDYARCNVTLVLDRFLVLALLGLGVGILSLFYVRRHRTMIPLVLTGSICAFLAITAFHLYIPYAEGLIKRAPIILESLR